MVFRILLLIIDFLLRFRLVR